LRFGILISYKNIPYGRYRLVSNYLDRQERFSAHSISMPEPQAAIRNDRHISVLIPGLFNGYSKQRQTTEAEELALPALETFLARADGDESIQMPGLEARLLAAFGVECTPGQDLPIAAVTRVLDLGVIDKDWWIRADPVHLQPDRDRLILTGSDALNVTADQSSRLQTEISEVYAEDGWLFKAPRPSRWYLKPPRTPELLTTPLANVIGRDIHPYLPQGKDGKSWHTTLNEIQILLHTSAVNVERERAGQLPVNSLWFWGGGTLPKIKPPKWTRIWSQEPVSLALARLCELSSADTPASFDDWRDRAGPGGEHLVVLDHAQAVLRYGAIPEWIEFLKRLEQQWMEPLLNSIRQGELDSATLWSDSGSGFVLTPKHVGRWWRRRRRLEAYG
jgi:hypothetical protein